MAPKRLSADARKVQIALTAASLFASRGFNGVTTREIAKKAKVNEAMIFRYFPTKEALYTEIINQKVHIKPSAFNLEAVIEGDDAAVFRSIANFLIHEIKKDNTFLRLMLYSALEGHELAKVFLKCRTDTLFDFLNGYISKRIKEGVFKDFKPKIIIRAFIGMFFHFIMAQELFYMPKFLQVSSKEAVEKFVDIFLNGVKK